MRRDLMDILACPVCRGALQLIEEHADDGDVITGTLRCAACPEDYPITDSIPNLLPPDMRDESE